MAFRDFDLSEVQQKLELTLREEDLFSTAPEVEISTDFVERLREDVALGLAINTEKARSECMIAPMLLELRRRLRGRFGLFSGVELNVDSARGLNGFCDFILSRSSFQSLLTAPLVAIVEAKNDNIRTGLGQCIATMVAAREFNTKSGSSIETVYGVVTTGSAWKFLKLDGSELTLDSSEYFITEPRKIMGILTYIIQENE